MEGERGGRYSGPAGKGGPGTGAAMQRLGGRGAGSLGLSKEQRAGKPAWWVHNGDPTGVQEMGEGRGLAGCQTARAGESPLEGVPLLS